MSADRSLSDTDHDAIRDLLVGHKVTKVAGDRLVLDNGTELRLAGRGGGCSCDSGYYDLTELNGVDNIITAVELEDNPGGDEYPHREGTYKIFVFADNVRVNLATFEGTDGNGCYGTGYSITLREPTSPGPGSRAAGMHPTP